MSCIYVTRGLSGTMRNVSDLTFLLISVIVQAVENDKGLIRAWLMTSGTILCVDQNFIDYAGWESKDLLGQPFSTLVEDTELLQGLIKQACQLSEADLATGMVHADTMIRHKYAEDVPVSVRFDMGGECKSRGFRQSREQKIEIAS